MLFGEKYYKKKVPVKMSGILLMLLAKLGLT
jgi:hypothetical protein